MFTRTEMSSYSKSPEHKAEAKGAGSTIQLQLYTEDSAHCVQAHLLLNAACGDEPVHIHLLLLAITPHSGSSLLVCCRIPVCKKTTPQSKSMHSLWQIHIAKVHLHMFYVCDANLKLHRLP